MSADCCSMARELQAESGAPWPNGPRPVQSKVPVDVLHIV